MDPVYTFFGSSSVADGASREQRRQGSKAAQTQTLTNLPMSSNIIGSIDNSYAQIHNSIDEAFGTTFGHLPVIMEKVRMNNQTVVDKLVSYENEFQLRAAPDNSLDSLPGDGSSSRGQTRADYDWLLDYMNNLDGSASSQHSPNPPPPPPSSVASTAHPAPIVSRVTRRQTRQDYDMVIDTPPESTASPRSEAEPGIHGTRRSRPTAGPLTPATTLTDGTASPSGSTISTTSASSRKQRRSEGLAHKFWQIASSDAEERVREFGQRYRMTHDAAAPSPSGSAATEPHCLQFLATTQITNGTKFLRMLPCLAFAIEYNTFEELKHRVQKRIALAHFYHAYTLAQQNPETFLAWCEGQPFHQSMLPNGGYKSIVLQRFADLMFPAAGAASSLSRQSSSSKARIGKIQTWRKLGKPWAKIIKQFGYGILLLVPPNLTDEDLRLAVDDELTRILRLAETQKHRFAATLHEADALVHKCLFEQLEQQGTSSDWRDVGLPGSRSGAGDGDWSSLLQSPHHMTS